MQVQTMHFKARAGQKLADQRLQQNLKKLSTKFVTARADADHVVVEGVNVVKKHVKPNPMKGTTGGSVEKAMPIHQSSVAIFNAATGKADRVGIKLVDGKRVRVFKSSGEEIKVA